MSFTHSLNRKPEEGEEEVEEIEAGEEEDGAGAQIDGGCELVAKKKGRRRPQRGGCCVDNVCTRKQGQGGRLCILR